MFICKSKTIDIFDYRINGIESGRLEKQLQILERQKLHTVRLVNNDIRLTRITLDHIEASSGKSVDVQGEPLTVSIYLLVYLYSKKSMLDTLIDKGVRTF